MEDRTQLGLATLAIASLLAGALVYVGGRPDGTAYLLPEAWAGLVDVPWLMSRPAQSLPSLAHALAFTLLTALCLQPWRYAATAACGFWLVLATGLEVAQWEPFAQRIADRLPGAFARWPVLDHAGAYFVNGTFDAFDLAACVAGCALAWLALRRVTVS
jgi:hypothetical protein